MARMISLSPLLLWSGILLTCAGSVFSLRCFVCNPQLADAVQAKASESLGDLTNCDEKDVMICASDHTVCHQQFEVDENKKLGKASEMKCHLEPDDKDFKNTCRISKESDKFYDCYCDTDKCDLSDWDPDKAKGSGSGSGSGSGKGNGNGAARHRVSVTTWTVAAAMFWIEMALFFNKIMN